RLRAGAYDRRKVLVEGHLILLLAQHFGQAAGNVQFLRKQYRARIRRPPEDRLSLLIPGKAAVAIGPDQPVGGQVAASGQEPVRLAHGLFQRRKIKRVAL
nr:hypothetical protein [Tanacetum cinerariifolium]